ncbi:MAG: hypothetical protein A2V88_15610 [Elusimicrobia bacterium RBG_16_66_12]|nr:MAG: hypothetical protein A2V88_15610 [Elusimicrobia bacterium RBG_16_66_12]
MRPKALAVFAVVFFVFLPTLTHQFVSWDDDVFLYQNLSFRGLGWTQLRWMATTFHHGPYQPVVWLSYAVDHLLWGMNPAGFHLTSLLIHCANAALVFLLGRRLLGLARTEADAASLDLAAAAGALFFALHPLRVEPVAWAAARRDLLSGTFFLCALLSHLRARGRPAFIFYCLSLLAKPMGIGLPLVLVILDVHVLRRGPRWKEKLPYVLPAIAAAALAWRGQVLAGATASAEVFGPLKRLAQAAYAHSFYLVKTAWPAGLAPMYERLLHFDPLGPLYLSAAAASLALAATAYGLRRRWPAFWASWLAYVVILAPVLGAVKYGSQLAADRYSYLPGLVWSLLAAGVLLRLMGRSPSRRRAVAAGACALLIVLAGLTRRQLAYWRDSESLYLRILAQDPGQTVARNNLGLVLAAKGRTEEALEQYRLALRLRPRYAAARNNLGAVLLKSGRLDEAEAQFRQALSCDPRQPDPYNNLALISAGRKRYDEALDLFAAALRADPSYVKAARNRELVLRIRDGERRR